MTRFAIVLIASAALYGQTQRPSAVLRSGQFQQQNGNVPQQPPYTGPTGALAGTVVDAVTGMPVKKAQVHVSYANGQLLVVTDASGAFLFDQLPPGTYVPFAQHSQYPPSTTFRPESAPVTLAPGEQKRGLQLKLHPGSTITGRVTDDDGDPMPNCSVVVLRQPGSMVGLRPGQSAVTNKAGEYTLSGVTPGKVTMQAHCNAPNLQPRPYAAPDAVIPGPAFGYVPVFYPGVTDLNSAQKVKLLPGQEMRGVDFHMSLVKVSTLTVHVLGLDEEHRARMFASLSSRDASSPITNLNGMYSAQVQPRTGTAQIKSVPPGNYWLTIISNGPERAVLVHEPVQATKESKTMEVHVAALQSISGRVQFLDPVASTNPIPLPGAAGLPNLPFGVRASASRNLFLTQNEGDGITLNASIAEDGSFTFHSVGPGHYTAHVTNGGFVQTVVVGGEAFDGAEFELRPGVAGPLEIKVSMALATLSGEIQIGDSHPTSILVFGLLKNQGSFMQMVNVGASGQPVRYTIQMAPGAYRVYAIEITDLTSSNSLMTSEALIGREENIDVKSGSETNKNLKLITAADLEKAEQ